MIPAANFTFSTENKAFTHNLILRQLSGFVHAELRLATITMVFLAFKTQSFALVEADFLYLLPLLRAGI